MRFSLLLLAVTLHAQTLGHFRILDFSAKTAGVVSAVTLGTNPSITSASPHGLTTGSAIWAYEPWTATRRETDAVGNAPSGNRGRGYFIVTVTDSTHFTLASEMYSGITDLSAYTVAVGDKFLALTDYTLRDGPRLFLDGPISKGAWSGSTTYRAYESVTDGGNTYMSKADSNLNHATSDTTWWTQVDPTKLGPGTFTASLRDTAGKASVAGTYTPLKALQSNLTTYFPSGGDSGYFDYTVQRFGFTGWLGHGFALNWMMTGDATSRTRALQLITRAEDLAGGSVACNDTSYCDSRNGGDDFDFERLWANNYLPAVGMLWPSLSTAQKQAWLDRVLNTLDVQHNGLEDVGQACTPSRPIVGTGTISMAGNTTTGVQVITGTGFSAMADLTAGSVVFQASPYRPLCRVRSKDSDTQLTCEPIVPTQALSISNFSWKYSHPFGYAGEKTCGWYWAMQHVTNMPHMIVGQESQWRTSYGAGEDDWGENNRTESGLTANIAIALIAGQDDIRAVRMGEQAINYYMTQTMAQYYKSRITGIDGHGTEYGAGRTQNFIGQLAIMLKNSLVVTPPGVITGNYIKNLLYSYQYAPWLARTGWVQPWTTGYPAVTKDPADPGGSVLYNFGKPMLYAAYLYPSDDFAGAMYHYFRTRRTVSYPFWTSPSYGDGNDKWTFIQFLTVAVPFYDPNASAVDPTTKPPYLVQNSSDIDECIASGLYCVPDMNISMVRSASGWTETDAQVTVFGNAAAPVYNEDGYGEAGSITILQNNTKPNAAYLLGGNGVGLSGLGSGYSPSSGEEHGNTLSVYDATNGVDLSPNRTYYLYAGLDRTTASPNYVYARVNLTPSVRDAAGGYSTTTTKSAFQSSAGVTRAFRHVIHFPTSGGANHVVVYDDIATSTPNQLRAYWHYQIADEALSPVRHTDWITTFDSAARSVVLTVPSVGRLSTKVLPVGGSNSVALTREDYTQPAGTIQNVRKSVVNATWSGGVATITKGEATFDALTLPVGSTITVSGVTPSGYNGTYTLTAVASTYQFSYALASNPGTYVSGGTVSEPSPCSWANAYYASGSCEGNYSFRDPSDTGVPAAAFPGTYRAHACASTDGTACVNATSGEWITVHRSSPSGTDTMPSTNQPLCSGVGGGCTTLEIMDSSPKVVMLARAGANVTGMSVTTTHAGTARYVVAGVTGHWTAYRNGVEVITTDVSNTEGSFTFTATAGTITLSGTPLIITTPSNLAFGFTLTGTQPATQSLAINAVGTTLTNWSLSSDSAWLAGAPTTGSGASSSTISVDVSGLASDVYDGNLSISTTTPGITNSPLTVPVRLTVYVAPSVTTSSLPSGTVNTAYSQTLTATGGQTPYTWSVTAGSLPTGLSLNSSTGVISGVPASFGTTPFTIGVTDAGGALGTRALSLVVLANPVGSVSGATRVSVPTRH